MEMDTQSADRTENQVAFARRALEFLLDEIRKDSPKRLEKV